MEPTLRCRSIINFDPLRTSRLRFIGCDPPPTEVRMTKGGASFGAIVGEQTLPGCQGINLQLGPSAALQAGAASPFEERLSGR